MIETDPTTDLRSYRYYVCNEQYQIQEELPKNHVMDYFADGVQVPLVWSLTDEGMLVFTNIWTKEDIVTVPIDLNGGEIESIQLTGSDPIYGITVSTMNPNDMLTFLVSNGTVISQSKNNTVINETVTSLDENGESTGKAMIVDENTPLIVYEELAEFLGQEDTVARNLEKRQFLDFLINYLNSVSRRDREIFVLRFWYLETPKEIAGTFGVSEKEIYNRLYYLRKSFQEKWKKEDMPPVC